MSSTQTLEWKIYFNFETFFECMKFESKVTDPGNSVSLAFMFLGHVVHLILLLEHT